MSIGELRRLLKDLNDNRAGGGNQSENGGKGQGRR
jgi:hypothetical protein